MPQGPLPMTFWESQAFGREEFLGVDLFVIMFAIDDVNSYRAAIGPFYAAIQQHYAYSQIMLVGTKAELRDEKGKDQDLIAYKDGFDASRGIRAIHYQEIDTQSDTQVEQLLQTAAQICCGAYPITLRNRQAHKMQNCNIM